MSWKNSYTKASFRGVSFHLVDHSSTHGRRVSSLEYPGRDTPTTEDMGRKKRGYKITGYILGENYNKGRDELIEACETDGVGELIHPFLGSIKVRCESIEISETSKDGGIVNFSLSFIEAGQDLFPESELDKNAGLLDASNGLLDASTEAFSDKFNVTGLPQFIADGALAKIEKLADAMEGTFNNVTEQAQNIADLGYKIRAIKAKAIDLINTPGKLALVMADAISGLAEASNLPEDALGTYFGMFNTTSSFVRTPKNLPVETATRKQEYENEQAINDITRRVSIAKAAENAVEIIPSSYDDGIKLKETLIDAIDDEIENLAPDDDKLFEALRNIRVHIAQMVPGPTADLATLEEITLDRTTPSLVLSYNLYDSVDLEADIVKRNKISHPAFIPGGKILEVKSE